MPRVLRILNRFNLGGPTYNAAYLTRYLHPEFETLLVGGEKDESEETSLHIVRNLGIEPLIIPEMRRVIDPYADYLAFRRIKKIIREFKPDIVHTHAAKSGFLGRMAANQCDVPVIVHTFHGHVFHSYFSSAQTAFYKSLEKRAAKVSNGIIAISEKQKTELAEVHKICPPEKVKVIPLGFDLDRFSRDMAEKRQSFRKTYEIAEDEIAIGIIGRLVPVKNHPLFIRALRKVLQQSNQKIRAFIIGDGEDKNLLMNMAEAEGIDFTDFTRETRKAPLTFTSWLKNIDWVNSGLDIVALTSLNEGTPVSLIEAQAAGKPIVSTSVGGIEDVVIPGKTALLSGKEDEEAFAQNLLALTENPQKIQEMSGKGISFVKEKFSYTRLISDMEDYYHHLLSSAKT